MSENSAAVAVRLDGVSKRFGAVTAVDDLTLEILDGEFFSMLGPSGSGKTTVLRMIAGFEEPTTGRIRLEGVDVTRTPPFARNVNTVFQDYALFPHMDVVTNVEYGLRVKKVPRSERRDRALAALATVRLDAFVDRRPTQLSGGQRQRVALARALVNEPKVLLLDEPLGALDLKLRREMQLELKQIQRDAGITFCFVTHDQEEALTMSDRIAVFSEGRIEQIATPTELYESPATSFVAGFVGTSNLLTGDDAHAVFGRSGTFSIRPEKMSLARSREGVSRPGDERAGHSQATGVVAGIVYLGAVNHYLVELSGGSQLTVLRQNLHGSTDHDIARGHPVDLAWADEHVIELHDARTPSPEGETR